MDWEKTVKDNLVPISYDLSSLSVLFNFIHGISATNVTNDFNESLDSYCQKKVFQPLIKIDQNLSHWLYPFLRFLQFINPSFDLNDGQIKVSMMIKKVKFGISTAFNSMQLFFADGIV